MARICALVEAKSSQDLSDNELEYKRQVARQIGEALLENGYIQFDTSAIVILCDDEYLNTESYRIEQQIVALRGSVDL